MLVIIIDLLQSFVYRSVTLTSIVLAIVLECHFSGEILVGAVKGSST